MSNPSKTVVVKRVQYGALPYRLRAGSRQPQFMLEDKKSAPTRGVLDHRPGLDTTRRD
jgi:hypothetical protein